MHYLGSRETKGTVMRIIASHLTDSYEESIIVHKLLSTLTAMGLTTCTPLWMNNNVLSQDHGFAVCIIKGYEDLGEDEG